MLGRAPLLALFLLASTSAAQPLVTLNLSSGAAIPGGSTVLNLSIAASGAQPAAAQWTLEYSPADFTQVTVETGAAAADAGKSISCAAPVGGAIMCVVFGLNTTVIADGVLARVAVTVSATPAPRSSVIQVTNPLAATATGGNIPALATGGTVTFRATGPVITGNGVLHGASFRPVIAPNTWVSVFGQNLASTTRTWQGSDFEGNRLPTSLDGTRVRIGDREAYVYFISPTQVNVLAPAGLEVGTLAVTVSSSGEISDPAPLSVLPAAPAFFLFNNDRYITARHGADNSLIGPASLIPGQTTPAKPGEDVELYGTGWGQTAPAIPDGQILAAPVPLAAKPAVRVGSFLLSDADVQFAGQSATGLYQLNLRLPTTLPDGDHEVVIITEGASSPSGALITVKR